MNSHPFEIRIQEAENRAREAEQALNLIYQSRSWRLTAPLRWFALQIRLLRSHGWRRRLIALIKKVGKFILRHSCSYILARPGLRSRFVFVIKKVGLHGKLRTLYYLYPRLFDPFAEYPDEKVAQSVELHHLPAYARMVLGDLKAAIEKNLEVR